MREDTFKINSNTGYLFPRNKENERQPDLNGTFNIEETIYQVAA